MSGLEAMGLACNIFEVISFAHETISFCKGVYEGEAPSADLHRSAQSLAATSKDLEKHDEGRHHKSCTPAQKRLHDAAQRCNVVSETCEALDHHANEPRAASPVLSAQLLARVSTVNHVNRHGDMVLGQLQRILDPKRGPEASTVLRRVVRKLHEYPPSFLPDLLAAGAEFTGPCILTVEQDRFFARTALYSLFANCAKGNEYYKPSLAVLLKYQRLPLTQKTCIGLSFVHGKHFTVDRHPISDEGQGTAQFYSAVARGHHRP